MKLIVCASMDFAKETLEAKVLLESMNHEVEVPAEIHRHLSGEYVDNKSEKLELDVIKKYYHKIAESDAILVLNYDKNGIEGYIGGNTFLEMGFAHVLDKPIYLLNQIPEMGYKDEIEAMQPVILQGNLKNIPRQSL
jgi:nucleoside 2-deoxyribosyltransferase